MLGICFLILKILGIIVLSILGLFLLILLLVFFAPINYSSEGSKHGDDLRVKALITYLNPIVRVQVSYPDEIIISVKIFGITVFPTKPKDKKVDEQKEKKSQKTRESGLPGKASSDVKQAEQGENVDKIKFMPEKEVREEDDKCGSDTENSTSSAAEEPKKQKSEASEGKPEQDGAKNSTLDTIGYYASLLKENKELIIDVLKTILGAFKTILPRKCKINAVFGTGQADTTGFIYAAYCSMKESMPGEIYLEPVWTESHIEGEYYLKGRIRIIHFLIAVIKIIANKKVRLLIKKLRRV